MIFFLNMYYCVTIIPREDRVFHPSTFARWFGWASFFVFTGMSLILIFWRVWIPVSEMLRG